MNRWQIGDVKITRVVESETPSDMTFIPGHVSVRISSRGQGA